jgi:hypothetical protein
MYKTIMNDMNVVNILFINAFNQIELDNTELNLIKTLPIGIKKKTIASLGSHEHIGHLQHFP